MNLHIAMWWLKERAFPINEWSMLLTSTIYVFHHILMKLQWTYTQNLTVFFFSIQAEAVTVNLQRPVHGDDECDVICGQTDWCQHNHHGYKASLWNTSSSDTGRRSSYAIKGVKNRYGISLWSLPFEERFFVHPDSPLHHFSCISRIM